MKPVKNYCLEKFAPELVNFTCVAEIADNGFPLVNALVESGCDPGRFVTIKISDCHVLLLADDNYEFDLKKLNEFILADAELCI